MMQGMIPSSPQDQQRMPTKEAWRWRWPRRKKPASQQAILSPVQLETFVQPTNFYERAIEWTHRADKVINLVLGYMLAIASVLGFMDVLSNGEVLSNVPYLFYVWLGIMGLGVDFQILLVIGRIPDLFRMPADGWQKWIIFLFNVLFLIFLAVMSVMTGAIFTQHRDVPTTQLLDQATHHLVLHANTITDSMTTLGIDSILFVYGRATLATLLLVLMAVDRTIERWRMQMSSTHLAGRQRANMVSPVPPLEPASSVALQESDLDKVLQTMLTMNQQNVQLMQDMNRQTVEQVSQITVEVVNETINRLAASISLPSAHMETRQLPEASEGEHMVQSEQRTEDTGSLIPDGKQVRSEHLQSSSKNYGSAIEQLLHAEPGLTDREIAERVGCGVGTANKWKLRIQQPT